MTKQKKRESLKSKALTEQFELAVDLHWICPKCKTKLIGTKQKLMEGCPCGSTSN